MTVRMRPACRLAAGLALAMAMSPAMAAASQEIPKSRPTQAAVTMSNDAPANGATPDGNASSGLPSNMRSGRDIYASFRDGLADPGCPSGGSVRWKQHFAAAPRRMASPNDDVLPLFGYVVDAVREAHLPTEYALIPFVESGYRPGARSPSGPTGLWQFIAVTAKNHNVPMRAGYDGRLSPVDSTRAAVRYLKTLHGMFAGDWRLAVMAYNAGEYRVLGSLRRAGQNARNAKPETLPGLSPITHAYVQKLRALSCLLEQADDREEWLRALDRPVAHLEAQPLPKSATTLDTWARANGLDAAQVRKFNPAYANGRVPPRKDDRAMHVLAPAASSSASALVARIALDTPANGGATEASVPNVRGARADAALGAVVGEATVSTAARRSHTVARGDSLSAIAQRYGVAMNELIARNKLDKKAKLRVGTVLQIDADMPGDATPPDPAAGP
ncbi:transglycosylase SLT domain-containing protein [Lysobacter sp. A6]|uniref:Transglycosylase SLT domain-containing protein n=2 Tax=Noviluteimonas lactosilytica TaxID=2888523 RepID=A0ABS8JEQ0_9GAMM|nr:lytic transglycosylase domain-containing protein [Lysobacter lactosilyticus]MCC8362074.1 transglycosylase SLT domain-containing protein [Lysobacter lactosilyticus]